MAASAISSVPGGFARVFRELPPREIRVSDADRAAGAAAYGADVIRAARFGAAAPEAAAKGSEAAGRAESSSRRPDIDINAESVLSRKAAILDYEELSARAAELKKARAMGGRQLEEMLEISALRARDVEVRRHEAAHMAAGNGYIIGGASFTYQSGPDGRHYAVGGEVGIDSSSIPGKPEETLRKMRVVKAAALAPARPSAADLAVAAAAAQAEAAALAELAAARAEELASRYSSEMAASRGAAAPGSRASFAAGAAAGSGAATLRYDGPPPTPFDVIA